MFKTLEIEQHREFQKWVQERIAVCHSELESAQGREVLRLQERVRILREMEADLEIRPPSEVTPDDGHPIYG